MFDTCNEIPTDGMPRLSRNETILLRSSERKDLLLERFRLGQDPTLTTSRRRQESNDSSVIYSVSDRDRDHDRSEPSRGGGGLPKDTHWFDTKVEFRNIKVPIRIPMTTFDEDVGEVCRSTLFAQR